MVEDTGNGNWTVKISQKDTNYPVDGEYVAIAKNKGGMTKVTFQLQYGDGVPITKIAEKQIQPTGNLAVSSEEYAKSASPQPRPLSVGISTLILFPYYGCQFI